MTDLNESFFLTELLAVLREAFEGAAGGSYFIDGGEGSGLLANLARLDAEAASREVGGTSIAAHAHHIAFSLEASTAWIRGERTPRRWRESWSVSAVDSAEWSRLQEGIRERYAGLLRAIEEFAATDADAAGGAIGVVAHAAYHLGAIRQKLASLR
jgi:hypothetical protein